MSALVPDHMPAAGSNELLCLVFEVFRNTRAGQVSAGKDSFPVLLTWVALQSRKEDNTVKLNLSFSLLLVVHSPVHHPSSVRD